MDRALLLAVRRLVRAAAASLNRRISGWDGGFRGEGLGQVSHGLGRSEELGL